MLNAVSRVWLGCIERYTWLAVFCTRTHVFLVTVCCSAWIPRKLSCPWYCCCLVDSGWTSAEHVALSICCVFRCLLFYPGFVSVNVFGTIRRRLACACASVDIHQSRSVVKFQCCTVSAMWCVFFSVSSQGRVFVHSCSQLQTCHAHHSSARLATLWISFVALLWSGRGITGELRVLKTDIEQIVI